MTRSAPIHARTADLDRLSTAAIDPASSQERAVVIASPRGAGADTLLSDLTQRVVAAGGLVLDGSCALGARGPFRGLATIVTAAVRHLEELGEARALGPLIAAFGMDAELSERPAASGDVLRAERRANLFEAVRATFARIGAIRRTVVLLREAQLADSDTLELLEYLLRDLGPRALRLPSGADASAPLVVIAAMLSPASDAPEPAIVERLARLDGVGVLRLGGLDRADVGAWLGSPRVVDRVMALTGGAPERLELLLSVLPDDLDAVAERRLLALPDECRRVLSALALADRVLSPADLIGLVADSEVDVARALARLRKEGLVERTAPGRLALSSTAPRAMVDAWLEGPERVAAHLAVAERLARRWTLEREDAELVEAARHFIAAGDAARAVAFGLQAGAALQVRFAFHAARELYRTILALAPEAGTQQSVRLRLAEVASALGRDDEARQEIERVLEAAVPGDEHLPLLVRLGELQSATGQLDAAQGTLSRALDAASAVGSIVQERRARSLLAEVLRLRGDLASAADLCIGALGRAEGRSRLDLLVTLGNVQLVQGRSADARASYEQALGQCGPDDDDVRARVQLNLGLIALRDGRTGDAVRALQESLSLCEAQGEFFGAALSQLNLGVAYELTERYGLAEGFYLRATDLFERLGREWHLANAMTSLADLYVTLGSPRRALRVLRRALPLAERAGSQRQVGLARQKIGRAEMELCRWTRAVQPLAEAHADLLSSGSMQDLAWTLAYLARAQLEAGRPDDAATTLDTLRGVDVPVDHEALALGLLVESQARLSEDDAEEALALAIEAREAFQRLGQRALRIEALALESKCHTAAGSNDEAHRARVAARALLEALKDAVPLARRERFVRRPVFSGLLADEPAVTAEVVDVPHVELVSDSSATLAHPLVPGLYGTSPAIRAALRAIERVARSEAPVLLLGESGTGKELVGQAIHDLSARAGRPYVRVNSAAFPETLLESELFGHEKGAFTGAFARRNGRFELADTGTLFLDEIGDITPKTQVSLLRVLQEREVQPVGAGRPRKVDVRVICATNRDLASMVREERFRLDLYYRIRGVTIELPPLRDRDGDALLLARHFLASMPGGSEPVRLAPDAVRLVQSYEWPGNVRELEHALRGAALFADGGIIGADHLERFVEADRPSRPAAPAVVTVAGDEEAELASPGFSLDEARRQMEVRFIAAALERTNGNITHAAELLKMTRPRLSQKIKEYDIPIRSERDRRTI